MREVIVLSIVWVGRVVKEVFERVDVVTAWIVRPGAVEVEVLAVE